MSPAGLEALPAAARTAPFPVLPPRWPLVEIARWIAIYAIIYLHSVRSEDLIASTSLTRFAVPFFVAACVFFVFQGVEHKPGRTLLQYAAGRLLRIYVPFLGWCGIYAAFKLIKGVFLPDQPNEYTTGIEILWEGTFYHLWFLPFIVLVSLVSFVVAKAVRAVESLRWPIAVGSLAAGAMLTMPAVVGPIAHHHRPSQFILDALPAAFWTMALGIALGHKRRLADGRCERPVVDLALLPLLGCLVWLGLHGRSAMVENLAGVSLLVAALREVKQPLIQRLERMSPLIFGVYLAHLLPIKVFEALGTRLGFSPSWQVDLAIFLLSAVAAPLIAWLLYRFRGTRWLVA
jgi:surface polysaccharide O-acyltransferase-like enzyme